MGVKVYRNGESDKQTLNILGQQVAQLKIDSMQNDEIISAVGQELVNVKLEILQLKGGGN